jgi:hypothetical protein
MISKQTQLGIAIATTAAIAGTIIHEMNGPHFAEAEGCFPSEAESAASIAAMSAGKPITTPYSECTAPLPTASPAAPGIEPISIEPANIEASTQPAPQSQPSQQQPVTEKVSAVISDAEDYGTGGGLTAEQSAAIQYVAMPQSYHAIKSRFGFPDKRDSKADYYRMADNRWVRIAYNANNQATWIGISGQSTP